MSNASLTHRHRQTINLSTKGVCIIAGIALAFSPLPASAQDEKPAKEAPAEEEKEKADAPPATPRDEATALKEFKAAMGTLKKWIKAKEAENKANPLAGLTMVKEMAEKITRVRTDGLPEDLAGEYKKMTGIIKKMAALFKGMPEDEAELTTWIQSKFSDQEFGTKMAELGEAAKTTGEKLKEIGKKYGISELDFDGKDDEKEAEDDDKEEEKDDAKDEK